MGRVGEVQPMKRTKAIAWVLVLVAVGSVSFKGGYGKTKRKGVE